jgi:hypothetical protein
MINDYHKKKDQPVRLFILILKEKNQWHLF